MAFGSVPTRLGGHGRRRDRGRVASVGWGDPARFRARMLGRLGLEETDDPAMTAAVLGELGDYYAGRLKVFGVPVDWRLTSPVQRKVLGTSTRRSRTARW
ncbi:hypothetical protein [Streptosporangium vulgare]|uniref:hypothetical protein n=1 Tax=Streptosporangium vulgare TaxID=46190 RepID=UPI0031E1B6A7